MSLPSSLVWPSVIVHQDSTGTKQLAKLFLNDKSQFLQCSAVTFNFHWLIYIQEADEKNAWSVPEHHAHLFLRQHNLLEFSLAGRSTVMPMHWLLLGFWGNVCNPHFITCDDPVQKLVAVIMVPQQKCQCWLHMLCFVFWCQLLWHPPRTQFSEQQMLYDNCVQQGVGNLQEMTAEFHNCEATILHNAFPHKVIHNDGWPPTAFLIMYRILRTIRHTFFFEKLPPKFRCVLYSKLI